jgi:hypothetical protein
MKSVNFCRNREKKNNGEEEYLGDYFKKWSSIKKFDFITFLEFLKTEAGKKNRQDLAQHFDAYITEINRYERDGRRIKGIELNASMILAPPSELDAK